LIITTPHDLWNAVNGKLLVTMETPDRSTRDSEIHINLAKEYFNFNTIKKASQMRCFFKNLGFPLSEEQPPELNTLL